MMRETDKYNDIINISHHQSSTRPKMSNYDRAAQFSPFAALKGYDDKIDEATKIVDEKIELDEFSIQKINEKLNILHNIENKKPLIKLTYFKADEKKNGGKYLTIEEQIKRVDKYQKIVIMLNGVLVLFDDI